MGVLDTDRAKIPRAYVPRTFATSFLMPEVEHPTTQADGCRPCLKDDTTATKMHIPFLLAALSLLCAAWGEQPSAPSPVSSPLRELPWGQLNFLHTTDTHGWIAGHLREPSYSADWGDYVSFSQNLKKKAEQEGKDLLLIDTGDRIEGSGLYDASHPKGNFSREIFAQQDIDVICIGNHESAPRCSQAPIHSDCIAGCTESHPLRTNCSKSLLGLPTTTFPPMSM